MQNMQKCSENAKICILAVSTHYPPSSARSTGPKRLHHAVRHRGLLQPQRGSKRVGGVPGDRRQEVLCGVGDGISGMVGHRQVQRYIIAVLPDGLDQFLLMSVLKWHHLL